MRQSIRPGPPVRILTKVRHPDFIFDALGEIAVRSLVVAADNYITIRETFLYSFMQGEFDTADHSPL